MKSVFGPAKYQYHRAITCCLLTISSVFEIYITTALSHYINYLLGIPVLQKAIGHFIQNQIQDQNTFWWAENFFQWFSMGAVCYDTYDMISHTRNTMSWNCASWVIPICETTFRMVTFTCPPRYSWFVCTFVRDKHPKPKHFCKFFIWIQRFMIEKYIFVSKTDYVKPRMHQSNKRLLSRCIMSCRITMPQ